MVLMIAVKNSTQRGFLYVQRLPRNTAIPIGMPSGTANHTCAPATFWLKDAPISPQMSPDKPANNVVFIFMSGAKDMA